MSQNIMVLSLVKGQVSADTLKKCTELYCSIWREPPWNEEFWKPEEVVSDILRDMKNEAADCFIATTVDTGRVLGFTWGYMASGKFLNEISGSDYFTTNPSFLNKNYYVDELGVDSECRGMGIGKRLSIALMENAAAHSASSLVLRTDEKAIAARALYSKLGFNEIPVRDAKHPDRTYWHLIL
jgi:ribosomal protein S18 acetylase RimI-like enzyme